MSPDSMAMEDEQDGELGGNSQAVRSNSGADSVDAASDTDPIKAMPITAQRVAAQGE